MLIRIHSEQLEKNNYQNPSTRSRVHPERTNIAYIQIILFNSIDSPFCFCSSEPAEHLHSLNLEIRFDGDGQLTATWELSPHSTALLTGYRLTVKEDGPDGRVYNEGDVGNSRKVTLSQLRESQRYFLQVTALGARGEDLVAVTSTFVMPPGRINVKPIKTSSDDDAESTVDSTTKSPVAQKLYITRAENGARGEVKVEWYPRVRDRPTMLRYAKYRTKDGYSSQFSIKLTKPGESAHTVSGLKRGNTYVFQVAKASKSGYDNWSDAVLVKIEK